MHAMNAQERFDHGVGPAPAQYLVPAPPPRWIPVAAPRPAVPQLPGVWIPADLDGGDPE
jgi:hypothetical protein